MTREAVETNLDFVGGCGALGGAPEAMTRDAGEASG